MPNDELTPDQITYCHELADAQRKEWAAHAKGYNEPEGYAASLRQQARWVRQGDDVDVEELEAAADFIDRQAERLRALEQGTLMSFLGFIRWYRQNWDWTDTALCAFLLLSVTVWIGK